MTMKHTSKSIQNVKVGETVYLASARDVKAFKYLGVFNDGSFGERRMFAESGLHPSTIVISVGYEENYDDLRRGDIFSDRQEANDRMKQQLLNLIDHYNAHQLRNNPIQISEEDKKLITR